MPTKADVLRVAHRKLGILSVDEAMTADQESYAGDQYDYIKAELATRHGVSFAWTDLTVPNDIVIPLAGLLAVEIAPHYELPTEPRPRALLRVLAIVRPDDRKDRRDTDHDGTVSAAEAAAGLKAEYY